MLRQAGEGGGGSVVATPVGVGFAVHIAILYVSAAPVVGAISILPATTADHHSIAHCDAIYHQRQAVSGSNLTSTPSSVVKLLPQPFGTIPNPLLPPCLRTRRSRASSYNLLFPWSSLDEHLDKLARHMIAPGLGVGGNELKFWTTPHTVCRRSKGHEKRSDRRRRSISNSSSNCSVCLMGHQ